MIDDEPLAILIAPACLSLETSTLSTYILIPQHHCSLQVKKFFFIFATTIIFCENVCNFQVFPYKKS